MEMTTATKKKKRRTRKCLDEIRKRSRRTMRTDYFGQTSQRQRVIMNRTKERQTPRLITMNRLTLNMFPKAIRSETITRPILEEIKQKSNLNSNEDLDKNIKINCIDLSKVECFQHCNSATSDNSTIDLEVSLHEHVSNHSVNLLRNNPSPTCVSRTQTPTELLSRVQVYSTSQSSQTSEGDYIHELYEELMNKISTHLNTVTSTIIKEDVIKIATVNLQKLYNKSWNKGFKTTMVENEKNNKSTESPIDKIAQNPLEYIRHKHVGHSDVFSLALSPEAAVLTETPQSSLTFKNEGIPDVTLYDTPEYNYYPHKLNE